MEIAKKRTTHEFFSKHPNELIRYKYKQLIREEIISKLDILLRNRYINSSAHQWAEYEFNKWKERLGER